MDFFLISISIPIEQYTNSFENLSENLFENLSENSYENLKEDLRENL